MNFKRRGRIFGPFITSALSPRCPYPLRVYVRAIAITAAILHPLLAASILVIAAGPAAYSTPL